MLHITDTSDQVALGRIMALDRNDALTVLRKLSADRTVMLDLRRLYSEEFGRSALHLLSDDAVLLQLADRIARGELTLSAFRPPTPPAPEDK
jgi:hypothetical protein